MDPKLFLTGLSTAANIGSALFAEQPDLDPRQKEQLALQNRLLGMDATERARLERQRRGFSGTLGRMFQGAKLVAPTPLSARLTSAEG